MNHQHSQPFKADLLVVDDTPDNLRLLSKILSNAGYKVRPVTSGQRALDAVDISTPDLILLDILMPGMDGYDVCRALKASDSTCEIPIIFLTALNDPSSEVKGFKVGAFDYITKPFNEQIVLARIETQLALEQQKRKLQAEIQRRQQIEIELRYAKGLADQANQAKSIFLANMSHELRTPMNAILGFAEIMEKDPLFPENYNKFVRIISQSGRHLLCLINEILDLEKIESGNVELNVEKFELRALLDSLNSMFRLKANKKKLKFTVDCAGDVPRFIKFDKQKLNQILINLLGNAFKFTDKGCVMMRVSVLDSDLKSPQKKNKSEAPLDQITLLFEVVDTGSGIAPENIDRIFKPFVQGNQRENFDGGTGLGLSISQKYAELMGGRITVSSEVDRGSTFQCYLPVCVAESTKILSDNAEALTINSQQNKSRILIVDNDSMTRLLLEEFISLLDLEVRSVDSGTEAIAELTRWHPDLIWVDLRMPEMDGYELTQKIRELQGDRTPKIIAMTANPFVWQFEQEAIAKAQFDDLVIKPFSKDIVVIKVLEHLGIAELN